MENVKELIDKMEEQDREKFISVVNEKRKGLIKSNQKFTGISDMIECAFIWRHTEDGRDFWEDMAEKYKNKED